MTPKFKWMTAGAAVLALVGTAALAGTMHHLRVDLPGGGTETIEYSGDTVPKVTFANPRQLQERVELDAWSPFAEMARMSAVMDAMTADMDREMQASLQTMQRLGPTITDAGLGTLPAGTESYTVTTISTGKGVCTRAVRITSTGQGMKPQMVSQSSGCDDAGPAVGAPRTIKATLKNAAAPRQRI